MTLVTKPKPPTGQPYFHSAPERTEFFELDRLTAPDGDVYVPIGYQHADETPDRIFGPRIWGDMTRAAYLCTESLGHVRRHALQTAEVTRLLNSLALNVVDRVWTQVAAGFAELFTETPFETFIDFPERSEHPAARAFDQLVEWLEADHAEVADAVALGRTTRYSWSREGHDPRASTVRKLYQTHAAVDSLRRALGRREFARWLYLGRPSPRELLLQGDLDAVQPAIREFVFQPSAKHLPDLSWAAEEEDAEPTELTEDTEAEAPRASGRRRRTARI
jgi:hypothetical protein